jgi:hypothetical protein
VSKKGKPRCFAATALDTTAYYWATSASQVRFYVASQLWELGYVQSKGEGLCKVRVKRYPEGDPKEVPKYAVHTLWTGERVLNLCAWGEGK